MTNPETTAIERYFMETDMTPRTPHDLSFTGADETTPLLARLDAGTCDTRAAAGLIREFLSVPEGSLHNLEMYGLDRGFVFNAVSGEHGFAAPVGMDCMFSLHFVAGRSFLVPHLDGMAIMPKEYHHQVVARAEQADARVAELEAQLAAAQADAESWARHCAVADEQLAALTSLPDAELDALPTDYERKVQQMKKDFPNGI